MSTASVPDAIGRQHQQKWPSNGQLFDQQNHLISLALQTPLQRLAWPALARRGITAYLRRDDAVPGIHQACSGNKFYKLFYNLRQARQLQADVVASFGGPFSNHLHALAAAGHALGVKTVGFVRGYRESALTPTLEDARRWGMDLHFLDKKHYRDRNIGAFLPILKEGDQTYYVIPEGGENLAGVRGCMAIGQAIAAHLAGVDYTVCTAVGTGTTLAGLIAGLPPCQCLGFSVLKGEERLTERVSRWLTLVGDEATSVDWRIVSGYHHGGYAKAPEPLLAFMAEFEQRNQLQLEPVYTAKMLWAIEALAQQGYWAKGSHIVAIHSGGLQGRRGFTLECS